MIGSFLTRGLVMIFGYAYPAYECFKTVEKNKPEIEQLRFWCQYWILIAVLTVCERIGDTFISWVPMYSEAKLAFYIYLWFPKTKGTTYVYASFFKPYVAKHETDIDRDLMELRTRAGDMAVLYCQKAVSYGQTRVFDVLQYVASQSTPTTRPPQNQTKQQAPGAARQPASTSNGQAHKTKQQVEEPPSPTSSTSSSQQQKEIEQELSSSPAPSAAAPAPPLVHNSPRRLKSAPVSSTQLTKTVQQSDPASSNNSAIKKTTSEPLDKTDQSAKAVDEMQTDSMPSQQDKANVAPTPLLEEAIRFTRARLRKARSTSK